MTDDAKTWLEARPDELLTTYEEESDPKHWPSNDDRKTRGDRLWYKKNAVQTALVIGQTARLLKELEGVPEDDDKPRSSVEEEDRAKWEAEARRPIAQAERSARGMLIELGTETGNN